MKAAYYKTLTGLLAVQGKIINLFFYKGFIAKVYGKNPLYKFFCTLAFLTLSFDAFRIVTQPEFRTNFSLFMTSLNAVILIGFSFYYKFLIANRENPQHGTVAVKRTDGKPALIVSNFYVDNIFLFTTINMFSLIGRVILVTNNILALPLLYSFLSIADIFVYNIVMWLTPLFLYVDFNQDSYYSRVKKKATEVVDSLITTPELIPTKG